MAEITDTYAATDLDFVTQLELLGACSPAVEFAARFSSLDEAWQVCEQGHWMLWLIGATINCGPWTEGRKPFLACALDCADIVKHLRSPAQAPDISAAVVVLKAWTAGCATVEEAEAARFRLYNAYHCDAHDFPLAASAAYAASHAAAAINATSAASACPKANDAVHQKQCADIIRQHYPTPPALRGRA
jgi:hypothetical protein